jgi:hypothetical protein
MTNQDFSTMSIEELSGELIKLARSQPTPGNVRLVALQTVLNARVVEMQTNAASQQVAAAQQMVASTQALANFTHSLVRATWALFFVAGATVLLTIVQIVLLVKGGGR